MLTVSLLYVNDPSVQTELKLSDEQIKKLTEHRTKWFNEFNRVIPPERVTRGPELSKANDKALAELLKPEQLKRLRELTLQGSEHQHKGAALRFPEIADELKLTDEQKAKARTETADTVLTKEQKAKWSEMKGATFQGTLTQDMTALIGSARGRRFVSPPATAGLLAWPSIQKELDLSDEQRTKVHGLRDEWTRAVPSPGPLSDAEARKVETVAKEIETAALALLKPEQKKRLQQIQNQDALRFSSDVDVFTLPAAIVELKLFPDQQKKLEEMRHEREKGLAEIYLSDAEADTIAQKAKDYHKESLTLMTMVLSAGQQEKLQEVLGKPFDLSLAWSRFGGPGGPNVSFGLPDPAKTSLVILGLPYAADAQLHKELKLSKEEGQRLAELARKYRRGTVELSRPFGAEPGADTEKKRATLAADTEKGVGELLSAAQLKRFQEVTLQQILSQQTSIVLAQYTAFTEPLKLSDIQREQLLDGQKDKRVLSKGQQATLTQMKGEPFAGTLRQANAGFAGILPTTPSPLPVALLGLNFADEPALHKELKLSETQVKQLAELNRKYREASSALLPNSADGETQKKREALYRDTEKALAETLTANQLKRFKEVTLQKRTETRDVLGNRALAVYAELVQALSLTESQREKLYYDEEPLDKILTKEQQTKWASLKGEPFRGTFRNTGLRGPGGGGFQGRVYPLPEAATLLSQASVQEELKLSEEQRDKVSELPTRWDEATRELAGLLGPNFGGQVTNEEALKKRAEAEKTLAQDVTEILKPEQRKRLHEIELQQAEKLGGIRALLATAGVSQELALTEDQQKKVKAINENSDKVERLIVQDRLFSSGPPGGDLGSQTVGKLAAAAREKLAALLTKEQNDHLKEMMGKAFTGAMAGPTGGGGFPRGGPFGGGSPFPGAFAGFVPPN
jgi:hypothetical protein